MKFRKLLATCTSLAALGAAALAQDQKPAAQEEMPLPPGWTAEDMQACMMAGVPGEMHEHLAKNIGVWEGEMRMWMGPDAPEPMVSECTQTISSLFEGRYTHCVFEGEMPGMGLFKGMGATGFDNVSQKFVSTWIDNHSTGIMQGTGELSADGKQMTWAFTYNCPINKKPAVMRQVESYTSPDTFKFVMYNTDPKSGKEYKAMEIDFKRTSKAARADG